ncbi:MAG: hypothetical protein VB070_11925 [Clostridiaceae bacterium]|nr:hypothetical protein [Clostridiaceae bacterium]
MKEYDLQLTRRTIIFKLVLVVLTIGLIIARSSMGPVINSSIKLFDNILLNAVMIIILDVLIGVTAGAWTGNRGSFLISSVAFISMIVLMVLPFSGNIMPSLKDSFSVLLNSVELSSVVLGFSGINLIMSTPKRKRA